MSLKLKKNIILPFILLLIFLLMPLGANSQGLVPCATSDSSDMCEICDLIVGFENVVDWGLGILAFLGLLALVVAGIMYIVSAGNESMMTSAKNYAKSSLYGIAIVLLAWVIVQIAMNILAAKDDLGIGVSNWYTFDCE